MEEIWKDIKGYENYYQVSNFGRVRSLDREVNANIKNNKKVIKKGKILKCAKDTDGYNTITLSIYNKKRNRKICRLVAETFIPNPNNLPQVNHIDGNKSNDNIENLEWVTASENIIHAVKTGLINRQQFWKKVGQYDENNNLIRIWDNIKNASKEYNTTHITACCKGKRKKCKGFKWRYINE